MEAVRQEQSDEPDSRGMARFREAVRQGQLDEPVGRGMARFPEAVHQGQSDEPVGRAVLQAAVLRRQNNPSRICNRQT
jgi:hypothetical protein